MSIIQSMVIVLYYKNYEVQLKMDYIFKITHLW